MGIFLVLPQASQEIKTFKGDKKTHEDMEFPLYYLDHYPLLVI